MAVKKVVIIGPESTGKSTLCKELAAHFQTQWCPEYAREYLTNNGTAYTYDDLLVIAKNQLLIEDRSTAEVAATENKVLFIDTDMYVMKVWCEYVFEKCHYFILDQISKRPYDLYILCTADIPWVQDALREYPEEGPRKELFQIYKDQLINQSVPWITVSGNYSERLAKAIVAVDALLNQ